MAKSSYKIGIYPSNVASIKYIGSLDPIIVQRAVEECQKRNCIFLVIDLSEVTYASSAAVGAFIGLRTTVTNKGGMIVFTTPVPQVQIVLDMMGFGEIFKFYDNADEALKQLIETHKDDGSETYKL